MKTKKTKIISGLFLAAATFTSAARGECSPPAGGSEHSAGLPFFDALAISSFSSDIQIKAERSLLTRQGFCPTSLIITEEDPAGCQDAALCLAKITAKESWSSGAESIWLEGQVTIETATDGTGAAASFINGNFNAERFGRLVVLTPETSQDIWNKMIELGVERLNPRVLGNGTFFAPRVLCSAPVAPTPIPACLFDLESHNAGIDATTSANLHAEFINLQAFEGPERIFGSVNTGLSLVSCSRIVYPGATPECVGLIENRPAGL